MTLLLLLYKYIGTYTYTENKFILLCAHKYTHVFARFPVMKLHSRMKFTISMSSIWVSMYSCACVCT